DLLSSKVWLFDGRGGCKEGECPPELAAEVAGRRQELVEAVAETDDQLLERYLDGQEPAPEELLGALRRATAAGTLTPVLVTAAARAQGAALVLDALVSCVEQLGGSSDGSGPPTLYVFKTVADPFGKISLFRVLGGQLQGDVHLVNVRTGHEERIARPLRPKGKALENVERLGPGDLGAATKLIHVRTGDTLGPKGAAPVPIPDFPPTSYTMAIRPKAKGDEDKIHAALNHMLEEDPTLRIEREPGTHETLLHGLGDVHLEVTLEKLRRKYQVEAVLGVPQVPYREAIRATARQQHKYKKQSGGAGLYGDCTLEIEPLPRGEGFVWEDKIFGGAIPGPFRVSVEKGVRQTLDQGVLAGYPLVDVKVRLVDGSNHPVDGKDIAFQLAGAMAMREGVQKAGAYLMEPVMEVQVTVPAPQMGDVIGHLNARRGHIEGMNPVGRELEQLTALVPLAEMYQFPIELRAATQGRGRYTMAFHHYEEVPHQVAEPIIAARQQHGRESGAG
ncbi:MAG: elongation factor G, partial [Candidatus Dormibacteria bacterium]